MSEKFFIHQTNTYKDKEMQFYKEIKFTLYNK